MTPTRTTPTRTTPTTPSTTSTSRGRDHRPPVAAAARDLLGTARHDLATAMTTTVATERYAAAHLAALRTAAAVLAVRTRPDRSARSRPRTVWSVLPQVAPELTEWAGFFAAGATKRAAAEAGLSRAVTAREADDLLRDAQTFLALVETTLGLPHQPVLPQHVDLHHTVQTVHTVQRAG